MGGGSSVHDPNSKSAEVKLICNDTSDSNSSPQQSTVKDDKQIEIKNDEGKISAKTPSVPATGGKPGLSRASSWSTSRPIQAPFVIVKNKSSKNLLNSINEDQINEKIVKIDDFLTDLHNSECSVRSDDSAKSNTSFRTRRLTYGISLEHELQQVSLVAMKQRTSIFSSAEIGVVQVSELPFRGDVMGTYSCHGIEPSLYEEDMITQKINQDRGVVVHPFNASEDEALFSVIDGHGGQGDKVSEFVMRQLVMSLEEDQRLRSDPVSAMTDAYVLTNKALLATDIECMTSGCTCVTVYMNMIQRKMWVANVGDSRAVMAYKDSDGSIKATDLSTDHKPDNKLEQERITKMGGYVCPPPEPGLSARVYLDPGFRRVGLAMSRSLGDYAVKGVGVIAEPEVQCFDMLPEEGKQQFIIMASDGVWEFISSQEAVDIVQASLRSQRLTTSSRDLNETAEESDVTVYKACQTLIEEATKRWEVEEGDYRDDITAVVVRFPIFC